MEQQAYEERQTGDGPDVHDPDRADVLAMTFIAHGISAHVLELDGLTDALRAR
ncbi:MAG: hypothetical protein KY462_15785 [Actinobacteria bacterium]|nr:hypothetical protein [Actinomycetota bacterium]